VLLYHLKRRLAAVSGLAGVAVIGGGEAEAVIYTPTAGIAAASGIPGFSFVDASNVTLGALSNPALGSPGIDWDVDGSGTVNFVLSRTGTSTSNQFGKLNPVAGGLLATQTISNVVQRTLRGMTTGSGVSAGRTPWAVFPVSIAYNGGYAAAMQPNLNLVPQFGFRFVEGADT
jgi:hypothetical protein